MQSSFIRNSQSTSAATTYQRFEQLLPTFMEYGYQPDQIFTAFREAKGNTEVMLNLLMKNQQLDNKTDLQKPILKQSSNDSEIQKAIQLSLKQQTFEDTQNLEDFIRNQDDPVGLKNLGMTCYFNTVVQTIFQVKEIKEIILKDNFDTQPQDVGQISQKKQKFMEMLKELQLLFAHMIKGKKSYADPQALFKNFQKFDENVFKIGEQADFLEFQNIFLELIEKAFTEKDKQQIQNEQEALNLQNKQNSSFEEFEVLDINYKQDQIKKSQQKVQENHNPITQLFYGELQECMQFKTQGDSEENGDVTKYSNQVMGIINLQVGFGDLYKALQNSFKYEIDEFQTEQGLKTSANIELKIKKAPKILNFYLNRLSFNKKTYEPEKIQGEFHFQKEIYLDHFMLDNDITNTMSEKEKKQLNDLDRKIKRYQDILQNWEKYGQNSLKLEHCVGNVIEFLEEQKNPDEEFINSEDIEFGLEEITGQLGDLGDQPGLLQAIQVLKNYQSKIENKKEKVEKQLKELQEKKQLIYNKQKQQHYQLLSIMMHEGEANSGHYFCYVYDDKKQCWWKCNDRRVTIADEAAIFKEAFGQEGSKRNACSLFYRKVEDIKEKSLINNREQLQNNYTLSARLNQLVKNSNNEFYKELDFRKVQKGLEGLKIKMDDIIKQEKVKMSNYENKIFIKYCDFNRLLLSEQKYANLGKHNIFTDLISQADHKMIEESLYKKENLFLGINKFCQNLKDDYGFNTYVLNDQDQESMQGIKEVFEELQKINYKILSQVYANNEKSEQMYDILYNLGQIMLNILSLLKKNPNYIQLECIKKLRLFINHYLILNLLKACFIIDVNYQKNNSQDNIKIVQIIHKILLTFYYDKNINGLLIDQIRQNLQTTFNQYSEKMDADMKQSLEQFQKEALNPQENSKQYLDNIKFNFEFQLPKEEIKLNYQQVAQSLEEQYNPIIKNIELWRNQYSQICKTKKLIDQEIRLNQEVLMYHLY